MLKANKSAFIEWGFKRFNRLFLNYHFEKIMIWNQGSSPPSEKTLFLINHSTWWDPLMIYYLNEKVIQSDAFGMMHEDGVKRFPFFRKIGAFSINPDDRRHLMDSLQYSVDLLQKEKTVWMFPQGREQHLEKRPLEFFSGVSYIVQRCSEANVVPISLYYSIEHTRKPNAYIQIGEPLAKESYLHLNRKDMTAAFETAATVQLDRFRERIIHEDYGSFMKI
ncbi:lysophospholipid acyltransferase family protein [Halobacillus sp. BBL2006]|uniref:lysophospholipid acyltransferase family protein n=1 Tax=Halobacillus sp. BBL2006 TaxID=1543706 RepID=UPI0005436F7F|nr:lysophospholipid acyltransferase family protein [Halobacillus sp. BBL2006]KHE71427.1 glycerol acyltransferase [Halobacillus sp. BBL2006]